MKNRLVVRIESVRIKGGIEKLNDPIILMDKLMERLYKDADELACVLEKYFETNKGNQYEVLAKCACDLAKILDDASEDMNKMQHQIVEFQSKTNRWNDVNGPVGAIRRRNEIRINPNVLSQFTYFDNETIMKVYTHVVDFSEKTENNVRQLVLEKDGLKKYWNDPQYENFSDFINEVSDIIRNSLKVFNKYAEYLYGKIQEYSRG